METQNTGLTLLEKEKPTLAQLILVNMPIGTPIEEAQRVALKEISNFEMILLEKPDLAKCSSRSVLYAVKQCISDGLTLSPSNGLVYLIPGKVKTGFDAKTNSDIYEWVLKYHPTANGRLSIAFQAGSILDVKRPTFEFDDKDALKTVTVEFLVPSVPAPRWEVIVFGKMHFEKWRAASERKNAGKGANALYTSWNKGIDPEFAATKAILHGLGKRGTNANGKRNPVPKFEGVSHAAIIKEEKEIIEEITTMTTQEATYKNSEVVNPVDDNEDLPV